MPWTRAALSSARACCPPDLDTISFSAMGAPQTQRAVVLAAGRGARLGELTRSTPKPLLAVAGEPIIARLLGQLHTLGVGGALVVVGHGAEEIERTLRAALPPSFGLEFVYNPEYDTTNNSYSLWLAREAVRQGCLVLEADVVTDSATVEALLSSPLPDCWAAIPFLPGMDGALLHGAPDGRLERLTIVGPSRGARGAERYSGYKSMGLLKISASYGAALAGWLDHEVATGRRDRYYDLVIADNLPTLAPHLLVLGGVRWIEIDTPEDLAEARRMFGEGTP
jgi:choline kinase